MNDIVLPDGGRVSVSVQGDGPPLLLLRPLGGSLESWQPLTTALGAKVRVIAFEPRGTGGSSAAPLGATTRSMAGDARAVLDALGMSKADVFGLSLGGMVACWLALDASDRVGRLVLGSTPARGWQLDRTSPGRALSLAACLARPARSAAACLATRVLSARFRNTEPERVAQVRAWAAARPGSHAGTLLLLAAAARHDVRARLHELRIATACVAGMHDAFVPPTAQRALAEALPDGSFTCIPNAGHDLSIEAPDQLARALAAHLERA